MGEREDKACLVDVSHLANGGGLLWMGEDEEAREVVLVCLDAFLQYLHPIDVGSVTMTDGSVSAPLFPADVCSGTGCVGHFDYLKIGMVREEFAALH